jgi:uncharacterized protein YbaR (Trm112 family)
MALEQALLAILVCPIDKQGLLYFPGREVLYNPRLRRRYRIEDGIPMMLATQADPVTDQEHDQLTAQARRGEAILTAADTPSGQAG